MEEQLTDVHHKSHHIRHEIRWQLLAHCSAPPNAAFMVVKKILQPTSACSEASGITVMSLVQH